MTCLLPVTRPTGWAIPVTATYTSAHVSSCLSRTRRRTRQSRSHDLRRSFRLALVHVVATSPISLQCAVTAPRPEVLPVLVQSATVSLGGALTPGPMPTSKPTGSTYASTTKGADVNGGAGTGNRPSVTYHQLRGRSSRLAACGAYPQAHAAHWEHPIPVTTTYGCRQRAPTCATCRVSVQLERFKTVTGFGPSPGHPRPTGLRSVSSFSCVLGPYPITVYESTTGAGHPKTVGRQGISCNTISVRSRQDSVRLPLKSIGIPRDLENRWERRTSRDTARKP